MMLKISLEKLLVTEILWNYNELITHLIKVKYNRMYSYTNTMILGVGFVLFSFCYREKVRSIMAKMHDSLFYYILQIQLLMMKLPT